MRKVTSRELGIIERALVLGLYSLNGVPGPDEATLDALRVVGGCGCGCTSIDFEANAPGGEPYAEGNGTTADGIPVGLILWERDKRFTGLEVYMLGEDTPDLPIPESLHRSDGAPEQPG